MLTPVAWCDRSHPRCPAFVKPLRLWPVEMEASRLSLVRPVALVLVSALALALVPVQALGRVQAQLLCPPYQRRPVTAVTQLRHQLRWRRHHPSRRMHPWLARRTHLRCPVK